MRNLARLFAVTLVAGLLAPLPAAQADDRDSRLRWQPCFPEAGPSFECATVRAPLDYDRPRGRRISLALLRLPASQPDDKIGSILINPGGPGASGVDFVRDLGPLLFTEEVRARFDLVGFDPRGIARSSPLLCFGSLDEALSVAPPFAFPVTPEEETLVEELDEALNSTCQRRGGPARWGRWATPRAGPSSPTSSCSSRPRQGRPL
jgi:pimeloyl-ACP methyl ester carboxylesterase